MQGEDALTSALVLPVLIAGTNFRFEEEDRDSSLECTAANSPENHISSNRFGKCLLSQVSVSSRRVASDLAVTIINLLVNPLCL